MHEILTLYLIVQSPTIFFMLHNTVSHVQRLVTQDQHCHYSID